MMSNKPTHGTPLTDAERLVKRAPECPQKGWQAGARFNWVSKFGSRQSNSGTHSLTKANKPKQPLVRLTTMPRWARKYATQSMTIGHGF